jgi:hypothetical protein
MKPTLDIGGIDALQTRIRSSLLIDLKNSTYSASFFAHADGLCVLLSGSLKRNLQAITLSMIETLTRPEVVGDPKVSNVEYVDLSCHLSLVTCHLSVISSKRM